MEDTIRDGHTAQRILADPVFQRAVEQADAACVDAWRQADTPEAREQAHARQAALQDIVKQLGVIAGRGEYEEARQK